VIFVFEVVFLKFGFQELKSKPILIGILSWLTEAYMTSKTKENCTKMRSPSV